MNTTSYIELKTIDGNFLPLIEMKGIGHIVNFMQEIGIKVGERKIITIQELKEFKNKIEYITMVYQNAIDTCEFHEHEIFPEEMKLYKDTLYKLQMVVFLIEKRNNKSDTIFYESN